METLTVRVIQGEIEYEIDAVLEPISGKYCIHKDSLEFPDEPCYMIMIKDV